MAGRRVAVGPAGKTGVMSPTPTWHHRRRAAAGPRRRAQAASVSDDGRDLVGGKDAAVRRLGALRELDLDHLDLRPAPRARGGRRGQMGLRGSGLRRRGGGWEAVCVKGRGRRLPRRVLCEELRIKLALPLEGRRLHVLAASEVARADVPHDVGAEQVVLADAALTCEAAGARVVPAGVAGGGAASARASPVLW